MSDVEVTIKLPSELLARARAIDLSLEDQAEAIREAVERQIQQGEAATRLLRTAEQFDTLPDLMKPNLEEIVIAARQARAEIAAEAKSFDNQHPR